MHFLFTCHNSNLNILHFFPKCDRHVVIRNPYVLMYMYCIDRGGSGGERVVVSEVNDTETIVIGLTPGVLYTFSVSAENDVSSQDDNINARSLSTTATTPKGGVCKP